MALVERVNKNGSTTFYAAIYQSSTQKTVFINAGHQKRAARELHDRLISKGRENALPTAKDITMSALVDKYLAHGTAHLRSQTISTYQSRLKNHIIPYFGAAKVRKSVHPSSIGAWMAWEAHNGVSDKTIRRCLTTLSALLSYAVSINLISDNPCKRVKAPRLPVEDAAGNNGVVYTLKPQEIQRLITYTPKKNGDKALMMFMATVGCRPSEAAELRFRDISVAEGLVIISRTATSSGANTVKNGKPRKVPLTPEMLTVLGKERRRLNASPDDLVFPTIRGKRRQMSRFARDVLRPSLTRAGLIVPEGSASLYLLRKSLASNLMNTPTVNIKTIATLLGQSEAVLLKHYAKMRDEDAVEAMRCLAASMSAQDRDVGRDIAQTA